eukprot:COSAG02_NODE_92_length_37588_cov_135.916242_41_plen_54_part_00
MWVESRCGFSGQNWSVSHCSSSSIYKDTVNAEITNIRTVFCTKFALNSEKTDP